MLEDEKWYGATKVWYPDLSRIDTAHQRAKVAVQAATRVLRYAIADPENDYDFARLDVDETLISTSASVDPIIIHTTAMIPYTEKKEA